jgi:hypothetical protein
MIAQSNQSIPLRADHGMNPFEYDSIALIRLGLSIPSLPADINTHRQAAMMFRALVGSEVTGSEIVGSLMRVGVRSGKHGRQRIVRLFVD